MHPILTFSSLPLFLGAVLSDWAYSATDQVQWTNFASWLIAGGLLIVGIALLWALVSALSRRWRGGSPRLYVGLLAATVVVGFINALVHARDAWAAMPSGLILSVLVLVLVAAASVVGLAAARRGVAA